MGGLEFWLLRKEWLLAQEAACDAMAVDVTSASHAEYGRMLLTYVVPIPASVRLVAIGVSEPYNTLKRRLNAMLKSQSGSRRKSILVGTIVLAIGILASAFTVIGHSQLPTWAPENPSPEFLRAAKVLKELPPEKNHTVGSLDVPVWECFGALTDQQIKDFMKIHQVKIPTAGLSQEVLSYAKQHSEATEKDGYLIYNTRSIAVPIQELSDAQKKAVDRILKVSVDEARPGQQGNDLLSMLYKAGAKPDLSNVSLSFRADGGHEVRFSFLLKPTMSGTKAGAVTSTSISPGPFGYISRW